MKPHMPTKRHKANNNMDDESKNSNKPLMDGCNDNWNWSKRHRSQEAILAKPDSRKGKLNTTIPPPECSCLYMYIIHVVAQY